MRYFMPGLAGGEPTKMLLMVLPMGANARAATSGGMEGPAVQNLIRQIYGEVYGRGLDDRLLRSFIEEIGSERITLE